MGASALATKIARFKGKEAAMIFPTGYSANVGLIAGLMRSGDLIVADQFAHASVVDGMIPETSAGIVGEHEHMVPSESVTVPIAAGGSSSASAAL